MNLLNMYSCEWIIVLWKKWDDKEKAWGYKHWIDASTETYWGLKETKPWGWFQLKLQNKDSAAVLQCLTTYLSNIALVNCELVDQNNGLKLWETDERLKQQGWWVFLQELNKIQNVSLRQKLLRQLQNLFVIIFCYLVNARKIAEGDTEKTQWTVFADQSIANTYETIG